MMGGLAGSNNRTSRKATTVCDPASIKPSLKPYLLGRQGIGHIFNLADGTALKFSLIEV
jgi:hypothetical protein